MKKFIIKLILFLIPVGLIFIFPLAIYILGREDYSIDKVIKEQLRDPKILYGSTYNSIDKEYKKQFLTKINPTIAVIGSSRSLEFKKEFFIEPNKFFVIGNGGNLQSVESLNQFVKARTSDSDVKLIILTLDPGEFIFRATTPQVIDDQPENKNQKFIDFVSGGWKKVYTDYFIGRKFSIKDLIAKSKTINNIGLLAIINQDGYRSDGSYQYTKIKSEDNRQDKLNALIKKELESIRNNGNSSEYGEMLSNEKINFLSDSLRLCKEKNIYVMGVSVPRPTEIYQELTGPNYSYKTMVRNLPVELNKVFSANGFSYYDLSDVKLLGASDSEFLDWIHPSDKMYLRMTIYMAEKNQQFRTYVDIDKLKERLKKTKEDFLDI